MIYDLSQFLCYEYGKAFSFLIRNENNMDNHCRNNVHEGFIKIPKVDFSSSFLLKMSVSASQYHKQIS